VTCDVTPYLGKTCSRDDRLGVGAALHPEAVCAAATEVGVECLFAVVDTGRPGPALGEPLRVFALCGIIGLRIGVRSGLLRDACLRRSGPLLLLARPLLTLGLLTLTLSSRLRVTSGHSTSAGSKTAVRRDATRRPATSRSRDDDDIRCLRALLTLLRLVLHARTLRERPEALTLDRTEVHKQILPTISRRDEPVALLTVEPLHGPSCHISSPPQPTSRTGKQRPNRNTLNYSLSLHCRIQSISAPR